MNLLDKFVPPGLLSSIVTRQSFQATSNDGTMLNDSSPSFVLSPRPASAQPAAPKPGPANTPGPHAEPADPTSPRATSSPNVFAREVGRDLLFRVRTLIFLMFLFTCMCFFQMTVQLRLWGFSRWGPLFLMSISSVLFTFMARRLQRFTSTVEKDIEAELQWVGSVVGVIIFIIIAAMGLLHGSIAHFYYMFVIIVSQIYIMGSGIAKILMVAVMAEATLFWVLIFSGHKFFYPTSPELVHVQCCYGYTFAALIVIFVIKLFQSARAEMFVALRQVNTNLVLQAQELSRARDDALAQAQHKAEWLATCSHELRTPVNGILGMLDVAMSCECLSLEENSEVREYVETAHTCVISLLQLLNDILDFSKIDAKKMTLVNSPFSLSKWMRSVVNMMSLASKQRQLKISYHSDPKLPRLVSGDAGRCRQILINLIGNAVKFTPSYGSITVVVSSTPLMEQTEPVMNTRGVPLIQGCDETLFRRLSSMSDSSSFSSPIPEEKEEGPSMPSSADSSVPSSASASSESELSQATELPAESATSEEQSLQPSEIQSSGVRQVEAQPPLPSPRKATEVDDGAQVDSTHPRTERASSMIFLQSLDVEATARPASMSMDGDADSLTQTFSSAVSTPTAASATLHGLPSPAHSVSIHSTVSTPSSAGSKSAQAPQHRHSQSVHQPPRPPRQPGAWRRGSMQHRHSISEIGVTALEVSSTTSSPVQHSSSVSKPSTPHHSVSTDLPETVVVKRRDSLRQNSLPTLTGLPTPSSSPASMLNTFFASSSPGGVTTSVYRPARPTTQLIGPDGKPLHSKTPPGLSTSIVSSGTSPASASEQVGLSPAHSPGHGGNASNILRSQRRTANLRRRSTLSPSSGALVIPLPLGPGMPATSAAALFASPFISTFSPAARQIATLRDVCTPLTTGLLSTIMSPTITAGPLSPSQAHMALSPPKSLATFHEDQSTGTVTSPLRTLTWLGQSTMKLSSMGAMTTDLPVSAFASTPRSARYPLASLTIPPPSMTPMMLSPTGMPLLPAPRTPAVVRTPSPLKRVALTETLGAATLVLSPTLKPVSAPLIPDNTSLNHPTALAGFFAEPRHVYTSNDVKNRPETPLAAGAQLSVSAVVATATNDSHPHLHEQTVQVPEATNGKDDDQAGTFPAVRVNSKPLSIRTPDSNPTSLPTSSPPRLRPSLENGIHGINVAGGPPSSGSDDSPLVVTTPSCTSYSLDPNSVAQTPQPLRLYVSVTDSGPGIALKDQSKLFHVFQQIDKSNMRKFGGTGLGLAISRDLVTLMNGSIGVFSRGEGQGSTFYFDIELQTVSASEQQRQRLRRRNPFIEAEMQPSTQAPPTAVESTGASQLHPGLESTMMSNLVDDDCDDSDVDSIPSEEDLAARNEFFTPQVTPSTLTKNMKSAAAPSTGSALGRISPLSMVPHFGRTSSGGGFISMSGQPFQLPSPALPIESVSGASSSATAVEPAPSGSPTPTHHTLAFTSDDRELRSPSSVTPTSQSQVRQRRQATASVASTSAPHLVRQNSAPTTGSPALRGRSNLMSHNRSAQTNLISPPQAGPGIPFFGSPGVPATPTPTKAAVFDSQQRRGSLKALAVQVQAAAAAALAARASATSPTPIGKGDPTTPTPEPPVAVPPTVASLARVTVSVGGSSTHQGQGSPSSGGSIQPFSPITSPPTRLGSAPPASPIPTPSVTPVLPDSGPTSPSASSMASARRNVTPTKLQVSRERSVGHLMQHPKPSRVASSPMAVRAKRISEMLGFVPKVLVVDDNLVNCKVARKMIEREGADVTTAQSGQEAIALIKALLVARGEPSVDGAEQKSSSARIFDLVFMDLQMPEMDGVTATRLIRELEQQIPTRPAIPIVALTATVSEEDRLNCLTSGMDRFLAKPIQRQSLRTVLLEMLKVPALAGSSNTLVGPPADSSVASEPIPMLSPSAAP